MPRNSRAIEPFASLDVTIDEPEQAEAEPSWPIPGQDGVSRAESDAINHMLDGFFGAPLRLPETTKK
jgi:hypothetical protein